MVWVQDAPEETSGVDLGSVKDFHGYQSEGSPLLEKTYEQRDFDQDSDKQDTENEKESDSEDSDDDSDDDSEENSDDESSEDDDEDSEDESDDEESSDEESENEEPDIFEYPDVIEGASKIGDVPNLFDEDIGGQTIDSVSMVAAGAVGSAVLGKRNTIMIGIAVAGIFSYIMYLLYLKIVDLREEISNLERQQEMGLNDKDVQAISTQVLEDFLREGAADATQVTDDVMVDVIGEVPESLDVDNEVVIHEDDDLSDEVADKEIQDEVQDELIKEVLEEAMDVAHPAEDEVVIHESAEKAVDVPHLVEVDEGSKVDSTVRTNEDTAVAIKGNTDVGVEKEVVEESASVVDLPKKRGRPRKK